MVTNLWPHESQKHKEEVRIQRETPATHKQHLFDGFQSENSTEEQQSGPDAVKLQEGNM